MPACPSCNHFIQDQQPFYNSVEDYAVGDAIGTALDESLLLVIAMAYVGVCAIARVWKAVTFKTNLTTNVFISLFPILVCASLGVAFYALEKKYCPESVPGPQYPATSLAPTPQELCPKLRPLWIALLLRITLLPIIFLIVVIAAQTVKLP